MPVNFFVSFCSNTFTTIQNVGILHLTTMLCSRGPTCTQRKWWVAGSS